MSFSLQKGNNKGYDFQIFEHLMALKLHEFNLSPGHSDTNVSSSHYEPGPL